MEARIRIVGLAEFNRSLRRLDKALPKALKVALNGAADLVITEARKDIPRRSGKAAASLKAASTRTSVRIKVGGNRAPYYPWLDFGGRTGRRKKVVRPFIKTGRYLYPALDKKRAQIHDQLQKALIDVAQDAGLEVD